MARRDGWIGGRTYDLAFFHLPSLLALAAGLACLANPRLVEPIWWLWVWLIEGPHLAATLARTYFDAQERQRKRALLLGSLLCFVPGLLVWQISRVWASPLPWRLLLGFAAVYSYFHGLRQHYGVMSIYHRIAGSEARWRRVDSLYLHVTLAALFLLPLGLLEINRRVLGLPNPLPGWAGLGLDVGLTALFLYTVWYAAGVRQRWRAGLAVKPAIFALVPVAGLAVSVALLIGPREPLYPGVANPEQMFLVVTFMGGIFHGLEYLGVFFLVNRKRYETSGARGFWATLGRRPVAAYGVFVVLSLLHVGLNAARGYAPGWALFGPGSETGQLFLALYWGVFFHHYYLDQRIWRVQASPSLRRELALEPA